MGQSNSQRRVQHQDVELWELYEEDERNSGRDGRYTRSGSESRGEENRRRGSNGRSRQGGENRRNGNTRRSSSGERNRRSEENYSSTGKRTGDRRSSRDSRDRRSTGAVRRSDANERIVSVYQQEQRGSRSGTARTSNSQRNAGRRPANTQQTQQVRRRTGSADASGISYIQPYPNAGERRRSQEAVYRGNARPVQSIKRRRARRRREFLCKAAIVLMIAACLGIIYFATGQIYQMVHRSDADQAEISLPAIAEQIFEEDAKIAAPELTQDFLEINEYSRPGTPLDKVNSIFVHYTANLGTSAAQNRSYFANLAQTHERSASAHLIIGYEGELIQCIPFEEQAYAVMTRNEDSISIECCFLSEDGSFTQETYDTLIHTLAWLLEKYDLSTEDILRHYDCGGKLCPLYYAENEGAWEQLKRDVADYMAEAMK